MLGGGGSSCVCSHVCRRGKAALFVLHVYVYMHAHSLSCFIPVVFVSLFFSTLQGKTQLLYPEPRDRFPADLLKDNPN